MSQQQPPPVPPHPGQENEKPNTSHNENFDQVFKVKSRWHDIPFSIFFFLTCCGFLALSIICLRAYSNNYSYQGSDIYNSSQSFTLNSNTVILFIFVIVVGFIVSLLYYTLAKLFPKQFIWITGLIHIVLGIATAIYYLVEKYYSAGVVYLVMAVFYAWCFYTWIPRIPFASLVLKTILSVTATYPSTLVTSLLGALTGAAFAAYFSVTLASAYMKYDPSQGNNPGCNTSGGSCSHAKLIGVIVFLTFAGYYITEVIRNVVHCTISGIYGSWYYFSKSDQGMPRFPACGAFRRAMTYSFGSICFGSLIVAIINFFQTLCEIARQNEQQAGSFVGQIFFMILGWFIGFLKWMAQYFNRYAYSYIALFGDGYVTASKATWGIINDRGVDALINDCLIGNVLSMGSTFVGYLTSLLAYLYLRYTNPAYNQNGDFTIPVVAFSFLIGFQLSNITNTSINSGVATFFIAMAKDPEVLLQSYPDLFNELLQVYPRVREKLLV